jgi:hypothetical protein
LCQSCLADGRPGLFALLALCVVRGAGTEPRKATLLLGSVGSVLGLGRRLTAVSTFADLQAALQIDEAVITVSADITVTESASDTAGLRVPAGVRATVSGPATLSGDGQYAILYVEGELNATALVFEGGYTGTYDESHDCGVDGNNYGDGGAVLVAANGRFHAKECDFLGNTGGWGGAIYVSAGAWAATTACVLSGNDAKGRRSCGCGNANCCGCTDSRGGAVFVSASGEYSDDNGLFLLNSALAGGGGGALYVAAGGTFAGWGTQFLDNAANNNDGQHVLVDDASVAASVACPAASSAMTSVEIGCGPGTCVFSLTNCRAPASGARAVRSYVDALSDDAADVATLVQAQATTHSVAKRIVTPANTAPARRGLVAVPRRQSCRPAFVPPCLMDVIFGGVWGAAPTRRPGAQRRAGGLRAVAQPHESVLSRTARAYKNFRLYPPTRGSTWAWYLASAEKTRKPGFLLQIFYESIQIFYNIFPRESRLLR